MADAGAVVNNKNETRKVTRSLERFRIRELLIRSSAAPGYKFRVVTDEVTKVMVLSEVRSQKDIHLHVFEGAKRQRPS